MLSASLIVALLGFGLAFSLFDSSVSSAAEPDDTGDTGDTGGTGDTPESPYPTRDDVTPPETGHSVMPDEDHADINDGNRLRSTHYVLQGGINYLDAGSGNDYIQGGPDSNFISAGAGDDLIETQDLFNVVGGGEGEDTLLGGDGRDVFRDTRGSSLVFAGGGDDLIEVAGGSTVTGGDGADSFDLYAELDSTDPVIITDFDRAEDTITSIRLLGTSDEGAELEVVDWDNGEGADIFYGETHVAHVHSGQGLELVSETDLEDGESGFLLSVVVDDDGTFTDGDGETRIRSGFGASTINGGGGDDFIGGTINVGDTPEVLNGGDGNDTITGSGAIQGTYTIDGARSQATQTTYMDGGAGDDILVSDHQTVLTGGAGADIFGISGYSAPRGDYDAPRIIDAPRITDFDPAEDMIMVDRSSFTHDPYGENDNEFTIRVWEDGTGADVMAGNWVVVAVTGGQTLTTADIAIAEIDLGFDLLGYH